MKRSRNIAVWKLNMVMGWVLDYIIYRPTISDLKQAIESAEPNKTALTLQNCISDNDNNLDYNFWNKVIMKPRVLFNNTEFQNYKIPHTFAGYSYLMEE